MSQPILVVIEKNVGARGGCNPASWEAISAALRLAEGSPVVAVVLEAGESTAAAEAAGRGATRVIRARSAALSAYDPEVWTQSLVQIIGHVRPAFVLFPHTYQVRDYAPRLATRMGSGLISDVTGIAIADGRALFTRPMFQGKWSAETSFQGSEIGFVTVQIGAFRADEAGSALSPIEEFEVTPAPSRMQAGEVFQEAKQAVDLTQAAIIVSAGRGIKEPKNLDLVRELAAALGGEIAASRPICDNGWLPMDRQIGSSGQTVAPKLYLAIGISGAIQHLVGMKGSRTVVAINKDPEAPIFEVADFGVVGNLFEVVPALVEEIRKAKG